MSSQAGHPPAWKPSSLSIVANCSLYDRLGHPQVLIRNTPWGGNSITFPLNANPRLFAETEKLTIAKTLLDSVAQMHEEIPGLEGTYVDSLGAWGNYADHRREHFAYTQTPLTYNAATGKPVINNRFTLLEFLWALRDDLHARDKLLFANGVHRNRRFHFFALDVMGVEGRSDLEQKRVMAYQKPFLLLIYNIHDNPVQMEHYYHLCTFYGIYPSFGHMGVYKTPDMYAPVAKLNGRFVPALRAVTGAGWQPITHARSSNSAVWLERWGPSDDGVVYLTVYNPDKTQHDTTIVIDVDRLGLKGANLSLDDMLSDEVWQAPLREGQASATLTMASERVRVLRLKSVSR